MRDLTATAVYIRALVVLPMCGFCISTQFPGYIYVQEKQTQIHLCFVFVFVLFSEVVRIRGEGGHTAEII
jgi:hypothetical protein